MNKHKFGICLAAAATAAVCGAVPALADAETSIADGAVNYMSIAWMVILVVFVIAEAATYQLITIWFAIGALGALICSIANVSIPVQIAVFLLLSVASLILLRPVSKKCLKSKNVKTNADSLVGMDVLITENVNNIAGFGKGKIRGMEWTVRSADNSEIPAGETAVVEKIEGVKLIASRKAKLE